LYHSWRAPAGGGGRPGGVARGGGGVVEKGGRWPCGAAGHKELALQEHLPVARLLDRARPPADGRTPDHGCRARRVRLLWSDLLCARSAARAAGRPWAERPRGGGYTSISRCRRTLTSGRRRCTVRWARTSTAQGGPCHDARARGQPLTARHAPAGRRKAHDRNVSQSHAIPSPHTCWQELPAERRGQPGCLREATAVAGLGPVAGLRQLERRREARLYVGLDSIVACTTAHSLIYQIQYLVPLFMSMRPNPRRGCR
jgi:hypothetical protein